MAMKVFEMNYLPTYWSFGMKIFNNVIEFRFA